MSDSILNLWQIFNQVSLQRANIQLKNDGINLNNLIVQKRHQIEERLIHLYTMDPMEGLNNELMQVVRRKKYDWRAYN